MRVSYILIFLSFGCRDKKIVPAPESDDSGLEDFDYSENSESSNDGDNSSNNDTTPNSEEDQSETPCNGNNETPSDTEDSDQDSVILNPEFIIYTFSHGYGNGNITEVTIGDETRTGKFSAILYDTIAEEYCSVDWLFDSSSVVIDENMTSNSVEDINGYQSTTWFGFLITSQPQTNGNCNLNENGLYFKDLLLQDEPGFGYGPLTDNLKSYLIDGHYGDWESIENYVFTGFVSSMIFDHGNRVYLDINTAYAYPTENGSTVWLPSHDTPQGTEIPYSNLPSNGFYVSRYFFAIPLY